MKQRFLDAVITVFAAGVGIQLLPFLMEAVEPDVLAEVLAVGAVALVFFVVTVLSWLPMQFPQVRRYLAHVFGIEGYWFETDETDGEIYYTFACIRYCPRTRKFQYKRTVFNREHKPILRWRSIAIHSDEDNGRLFFYAVTHQESDGIKVPSQGELVYSGYRHSRYMSVAATYTISGSGIASGAYRGERIPGKFVKKELGKSSVDDDTDRGKIVAAILAHKAIRGSISPDPTPPTVYPATNEEEPDEPEY